MARSMTEKWFEALRPVVCPEESCDLPDAEDARLGFCLIFLVSHKLLFATFSGQIQMNNVHISKLCFYFWDSIYLWLAQNYADQTGLTLRQQFPCLSLLSARITGGHHCVWSEPTLFFNIISGFPNDSRIAAGRLGQHTVHFD